MEPFQGGKPQARRVTGSGTELYQLHGKAVGKRRPLSDLAMGFSLREIKPNVQGATAGLPWATQPVSKQHGHSLLCSVTDGERYVKKGFSSKSKVPFILFIAAATPYQDIPHTAIYGTMVF